MSRRHRSLLDRANRLHWLMYTEGCPMRLLRLARLWRRAMRQLREELEVNP